MKKHDDWIYDVEVLKNVFTCTALSYNTGEIKRFEISPRRNDIKHFLAWMNRLQYNKCRMVGFNNLHYDYPIIHFLCTVLRRDRNAKRITKNLYNKSQAIFRDSDNPVTKFKHTLWPNQHIVKQADLFKIHHFDNNARRTSLKRLQFNMRLKSIEEFEMDFDKPIKKLSILKSLVKYNDHDTISTKEFLDLSQPQIEFREELERRLGKSFINDNDTKIGEKYLTDQLIEEVGEDVLYTEGDDGKRKKRITKRKVMPIKDLLFPYIKFKHPELRKVYNKLKRMKVFMVNGKFHWNENDDYTKGLGRIINMEGEIKKANATDKPRLNDKLAKLKKKYNNHDLIATVDGFEFVFGKGGLHGTLRNTYVETTKERMILDLDVTSYYPKIGIENGMYPEHLTDAFCEIYSKVYEMRREYAKGTPENKMLKLALNGTYGKTNSIYSVFCDPKYTIQTTINGQLMLCMLWDWLMKIPDVKIIQANTDGITIELPKTKKAKTAVKKVCRRWQKLTRLQLESVVYSRMWIRDGNNYIAEKMDGKLKSKGDYLYSSLYHDKDMDTDGVEWHKDHSMIVVRKAVEAELVNGMPASRFIIEHDNIYDFFLVTNVNRKSKLWVGDGIIPAVKKAGKTVAPAEIGFDNRAIQRNSRYLISNSNNMLTKQMPGLRGDPHPRYIGINVGYNVSVYNVVESEDINDYDINYQFYIDEAEKLLKPFNGVRAL